MGSRGPQTTLHGDPLKQTSERDSRCLLWFSAHSFHPSPELWSFCFPSLCLPGLFPHFLSHQLFSLFPVWKSLYVSRCSWPFCCFSWSVHLKLCSQRASAGASAGGARKAMNPLTFNIVSLQPLRAFVTITSTCLYVRHLPHYLF